MISTERTDTATSRALSDAVPVQELARSNRGTDSIITSVRGNLVAWQKRIVADYIGEHWRTRYRLHRWRNWRD